MHLSLSFLPDPIQGVQMQMFKATSSYSPVPVKSLLDESVSNKDSIFPKGNHIGKQVGSGGSAAELTSPHLMASQLLSSLMQSPDSEADVEPPPTT